MRRQAGDLGNLGVEVPASPLRGRTGSDLPSPSGLDSPGRCGDHRSLALPRASISDRS